VDRTPELDQVRQLLFRDVPVEEGWARIADAMERAADPKRVASIEKLAREDLAEALRQALHDARERDQA
jgi:hypothetical protein